MANNTRKKERVQWHPAFCSAMHLEFREYAEYLEYTNEYNLNKKPLQIDLLIIKKIEEIFLDHDMGRLFRRHNIIEYKSPEDSMNEDVFLKVVSYACLYKASEKHVGDIEVEDVSITLVRKRFPRKLFQWLRKRDYKVFENSKGVYYVKGGLGFPIQIVVVNELSEKSPGWLTLLSNNLSEEEAKRAIRQASMLESKEEKEYVDSLFQVVVSENQKIFDIVKKEEVEMCQALRELMEPEIREAVQEAVQQEQKMHIQRMVAKFQKMNEREEKIISLIMDIFDLPEADAREYLK